MKQLLAGLALGIFLLSSSAFASPDKPTIVLVHGAFADSSSWNGVTQILEKHGFRVIAAAIPLRSVKSDARYVADLLVDIKSPVVLVGHSYAGSVISEAANGNSNVTALVYVAAFAPDLGESAAELTGKLPGSTLGAALAPPVHLSSGGDDLYVQQSRFPEQFAADVPRAAAQLMAAAQRPIAESALNEASGEPAWKHIPVWFIYGDADKNIPPAAFAFMAHRAHAESTVVVKGASHLVMVSHPLRVARLIETAAANH